MSRDAGVAPARRRGFHDNVMNRRRVPISARYGGKSRTSAESLGSRRRRVPFDSDSIDRSSKFHARDHRRQRPDPAVHAGRRAPRSRPHALWRARRRRWCSARSRGRDVVFLARHGHGHTIPPHRVNYRANLWALQAARRDRRPGRRVGRRHPAARAPGDLVLPHQLIDYTQGREATFFDGGDSEVVHIDFTHPYTPELRATCLAAARAAGHRARRRRRLRRGVGAAARDRGGNRPDGARRRDAGRHDRHARSGAGARARPAVCGDRGGRQPCRGARRLARRRSRWRASPGCSKPRWTRSARCSTTSRRSCRARRPQPHDPRRAAHGRPAAAGSARSRSSASARPSSTRSLPTCATRWRAQNGAGSPRRRSACGCGSSSSASSATTAIRTPSPCPTPSSSIRCSRRCPTAIEEGWEGLPVGARAARRRAALHARCATRASTRRDGRSSARRRASTPASSSTSATTCDGILYPMRMRDLRSFGFTDVLFPGRRARRGVAAPVQPVLAELQLLVERRSRAAAAPARRAGARRRQEDVLGALAQRVDLGAGDVDVRLGERVGDLREQARAGRRRRSRGCSACPCRRGRCCTSGDSGKCLQVPAHAARDRRLERRRSVEHALQLELDRAGSCRGTRRSDSAGSCTANVSSA